MKYLKNATPNSADEIYEQNIISRPFAIKIFFTKKDVNKDNEEKHLVQDTLCLNLI